MLHLDGSMGEGGGQILRSALGLSLVTGTPFRIDNIRKKRKKPGLLRQHRTAVLAATRVGCATSEGDELGSRSLTFVPGGIAPGEYHFDIGSAGSTSLVLQAILPALLLAPGPTCVVIEGGTHNPWAPPFEFLAHAFLPLLHRMGADVTIELARPGFHPGGGGKIVVTVQPMADGAQLQPLHLTERGKLRRRMATAKVANLPTHIADRELDEVRRKLELRPDEIVVKEMPDARGPGNALTIRYEFEHVTEVFTAFGESGKPAEAVARGAVRETRRYLKTDAPVGVHLADQLLIPMAMAGEGSFRTMPLTEHTRTNIEVVEQFLPVRVQQEQSNAGAVVTLTPRSLPLE